MRYETGAAILQDLPSPPLVNTSLYCARYVEAREDLPRVAA